MKAEKNKFENLFSGDRSFSIVHSVMAYFSQLKTNSQVEDFQKDQWNNILHDNDIPQKNLKHIFYKLQYQLLLEKNQRQKRFMIRLSQIAAILILPLALFFLYQNNEESNNQVGMIEIHCPRGTRSSFTLPDGSSGWLAGGSVMSYNTNFKKERNVSVDGEAFFSVKRDEKHPFKVKLNELDVTVLGTKFNVLNYSEDPISEVVVLSGLVEVKGNTKKFSEKLSTNRKLQLLKGKNELYLSDVNAKSYSSWIDGKLEFNSENLISVCRKIERFYDVDITLDINGLENQLFRASIKIGSINELLKYMSLTLPIQYELIEAKESEDGDLEQRKLKISMK